MEYILSVKIDINKKDDYLKAWRFKQKDSQEAVNWVISHIVEGIPFKCCRKEE